MMGFYKFETGWMEISGGQGVYSFISSGAYHFKMIKGVGFGRIFLFGFFMYFCFFYN
jgi:hypothetical protein